MDHPSGARFGAVRFGQGCVQQQRGELCAERHAGRFVGQPQGQVGRQGADVSGHRRNPDRSEGAAPDSARLRVRLGDWARELGFGAVAVGAATADPAREAALASWLADGCHGDMDYMARYGMLRARPAELLPGTLRVISARLDYWPQACDATAVLADAGRAYVSRYALGRDYHKVLRQRLKRLAERIAVEVPHQWRVFTDSAPLMEVALARSAGLGWQGKHTLSLSREAGSLYFLGEILTDLALPVDAPADGHCGRCRACLDACPTGAIVAPYRVDARLCISYLTIEHAGPIPEPLRPLLGNRIYGCDDCQLCCPWNRFARVGAEPAFAPRHALDDVSLVALFAWSGEDFRERMVGSPIYRIGYERWRRNLAVALGNAPALPDVVGALAAARDDASTLVREHVRWALARHGEAI